MIENFIALDFETAIPGKSPPPCSMGITLVENSIIVSSSNYFINPEVPINHYCQKIHGITDDMVKDAPVFADVWKSVSHLFSKYPVVIHNAAFDVSVLAGALMREQIEMPKIAVYDTMLISKNLVKTEKYSLPYMCEYFKIPIYNHHSSGDDSEMCANLFIRLQEEYNEDDITKCQYIYNNQYCSNDCDDCRETNDNRTEHYRKYIDEKSNYVVTDVCYDTPLDFEFNGKSFVLTGKIGDFDRAEIKIEITNRGGVVKGAVSRTTDYLIVGMEDLHAVSDKQTGKSRKIKEAEVLRENGKRVKIISADFFLSKL